MGEMTERMTGYYLTLNTSKEMESGVHRKITMQLAEFNKHFDVGLACVTNPKKNFLQKAATTLPFCGTDLSRLPEDVYSVDFVYVRKWFFGPSTLRFFSKLKQCNPKVKLIVELYTYPYDGEMYKNPIMVPLEIQDLLFRSRCSGYVDRYVVYTDDSEAFGVKTLKSMNGIDPATVPVVSSKEHFQGDAVVLLAVANMRTQHGYERIIEGMKKYYEAGASRCVVAIFVGGGDECVRYKKMVHQYNLEDVVFFTGHLKGDVLDKVYDLADIALGTFGMYKIGVDLSSALKTREYFARGLPLVDGCAVDIVDDDYYFMRFPNDASLVDINEVVEFYDRMNARCGRDERAKQIRRVAEERCSMTIAMKPIVDYIKDGDNA